MRLSIISVCLLLLAGCTRKTVVEPESFIEDPLFLEYLISARDMEGNPSFDLDGDGNISIEEAVTVEEIYLDNEGGDRDGHEVMAGVRSLAGIEYFTSLRRLGVGNNSLTALDLSRNTHLTYLNCSDNRLTSIVLPAGSPLETLNCNGNGLSSLNVAALPALKYLYCTRNRLTQLDVGGCPGLVELSCDRNNLAALDVSGCGALTDLNCAGNGLVSLSLPENSALVRLDCGTNEHGGESVSNGLEEIDLTGQDNLSLLRVNGNPLTALDLSQCTSLRTLECVACMLPELDITAASRLRSLCNDNPDGMTIYVPAGFNPHGMLDWNIGTATVIYGL